MQVHVAPFLEAGWRRLDPPASRKDPKLSPQDTLGSLGSYHLQIQALPSWVEHGSLHVMSALKIYEKWEDPYSNYQYRC